MLHLNEFVIEEKRLEMKWELSFVNALFFFFFFFFTSKKCSFIFFWDLCSLQNDGCFFFFFLERFDFEVLKVWKC
jgi:hypothetical protein